MKLNMRSTSVLTNEPMSNIDTTGRIGDVNCVWDYGGCGGFPDPRRRAK
jgi:hypothetical protein